MKNAPKLQAKSCFGSGVHLEPLWKKGTHIDMSGTQLWPVALLAHKTDFMPK